MKFGVFTTKPRQRTRAGYSFIEALMGLMIMGISMSGLLTAVTVVSTMHGSGRDLGQATEIMTEALDSVRLYSWNQITNPAVLPASFTVVHDGVARWEWSSQFSNSTSPPASGAATVYHGRVTLEDLSTRESYRGELKQLRVRLQWKTGQRLQDSEMRTLITPYGLQGYLVN